MLVIDDSDWWQWLACADDNIFDSLMSVIVYTILTDTTKSAYDFLSDSVESDERFEGR